MMRCRPVSVKRPLVSLAELDNYVARGNQELLDVGVSRARAHLVVIGSNAPPETLPQNL